jgi:hypothetical protein
MLLQKYQRQPHLMECENDFLTGCSRLYCFLPLGGRLKAKGKKPKAERLTLNA